MMIGEENQQNSVQISPRYPFDDARGRIVFPLQGISVNDDFNSNSVSEEYSPLFSREALMKYQGYIPANDEDSDLSIRESDIPIDAYSCDEFRIYEFKITRCVYGKSHDWTECPFAHPGEKARRRDPRKVHYSGTACPDFRKGNCKKGDSCEFAHGVFECWLHPTRYRTQPCKDGTSCRRRVCFFAHTPEQLRVLPQLSPRTPVSTESYDGSPSRIGFDSFMTKGSIMPSPLISPASESPPMSPNGGNLSRSLGSNSVNEVLNSLRNLQLNKVKSVSSSWGVQIGSGICSPRGLIVRPGFYSLPSTPTRSGPGYLDFWERNSCVEEPVMERVESGRDLRAKIYEKLSKENLIERVKSPSSSLPPVPDVGWVSELVK